MSAHAPSRPLWTFAPSVPAAYRTSWWGGLDARLRRTLAGAAAVGALLLIVVQLTPPQPEIVSVSQVSEQFARLILDPPKPRTPAVVSPPSAPVSTPGRGALEPEPIAQPAPAPVPRALPRSEPAVGGRRVSAPVAPDLGAAGRERAEREVTQQLAATTASVRSTLAGLSSSLSSAHSASTPARKPDASGAGRTLSRDARSAAEVSGGSAPKGDLAGSAVGNSTVGIAAVLDVKGGGSSAGSTGGASASAGGRRGRSSEASAAADGAGGGRSQSSLLAIVRRYAAGIQLCYDDELQRSPGLRGKLSITLTVTPLGEVSAVDLVEDTLGATRVSQCVLGQVRGWRFPAAPGGDTSFTAPFVFTPPADGK